MHLSIPEVERERDLWVEDARRYAQNADYWRERAEIAEAKLGIQGMGEVVMYDLTLSEEMPAQRSIYDELGREVDRLAKVIEVLHKRLDPVLVPTDEPSQEGPVPVDVCSRLGQLVGQYRKAIGTLEKLSRRIEL